MQSTAGGYRENDPEIVRRLLEASADVDARRKDERTALHDAARDDLILMSARRGADVNAKNAQGNQPLMNSTFLNDTADDVRVMLEACADANAKNDKGMTPLHSPTTRAPHYALYPTEYHGDHVDPAVVVRLLLEAGADIDAKTSIMSRLS